DGKSTGRNPHRSLGCDAARARHELVGHVPLERGINLEFRQIPGSDGMDDREYLLTVFLYPPDLSQEEEHRARFENNRMEFYLTFIAVCLLDIAQTGLRG